MYIGLRKEGFHNMSAAVSKNDFSKGAMWRNILSQAIPLTIANAVQVLYNVVDRIYLGHLPGTSSLALTGVGLIFPIVALITAFCNLFASGGAPLCSMARGAGNLERAEKIQSNTFAMLVLMAAVLTAVGYCFRKPILYLFGASDETYVFADAYLVIYLAASPTMSSFSRIGDLSFGMYVYSFPVQQLLVHIFPGWPPLSNFLLTLAIVLPIAAWSWRCIEGPALRLKQRSTPTKT